MRDSWNSIGVWRRSHPPRLSGTPVLKRCSTCDSPSPNGDATRMDGFPTDRVTRPVVKKGESRRGNPKTALFAPRRGFLPEGAILLTVPGLNVLLELWEKELKISIETSILPFQNWHRSDELNPVAHPGGNPIIDSV
jgi:hypothetical protein